MKCSAMQPCYLPWLGHLRLVALSDYFVFLSDAQYSKNSWHNRNRILTTNKTVSWITVPVSYGNLGTALDEVRIDVDPRWRRKHAITLRQNYSKHPHFSDLLPLIEKIEFGNQSSLADLNMDLLVLTIRSCDFKATILDSRGMQLKGKRSEKLENLCVELNCDTYLSTPGAREYLEFDGFGAKNGITLEYLDIDFPQYFQRNSDFFVAQMSFVDALANLGWRGMRELLLKIR